MTFPLLPHIFRKSEPENQPITAEELARKCAVLASDKKAEEIVILNLQGISTFTDFFVICSATSDPHLRAIASSIRDGLLEQDRVKPLAVDGMSGSQWIILDFAQVLVHVFHQEKRDFYSLEALWSDAPRLEIPEAVS